MQLAQPHRIQPPAFGAIHQFERLRERLGVRASRQGRELVEDAEFHYWRPLRMDDTVSLHAR